MKKKIFSIAASLALVLFGWQAGAQCIQTATFQQPVNAGDEAVMISSDGCIPTGYTNSLDNLNFYGLQDLEMTEWTIYGLNCNLFHARTLIRFDAFTLPAHAVITQATLVLNGIPTSTQNTLGNTEYPGTPFLSNDGTVYMVDGGVASNWIKTAVTWNTAPTTDPITDPIIPTTMQWNNNFAIDVTNITTAIWNNMNASLLNNGYWLQLNASNYYRNTMWASSFNTYSPPPSLIVQYYICDATFNYCSSSPDPNTFNFSAINPTSCYNYVWNYGDGSPDGTGTSSTHTYANPGTYTACLMLEDGNGNVKCEECVTICVNQTSTSQRPAPTHADNNTLAAPVNLANLPTVRTDNTVNILSVSPNPATSQMDVNLFVLRGGNLHYNVYDMQGKLIAQGDNVMAQGTQKFSINVNKLVPGNYLLELKDSYSTTAKTKFTKE